MLLRKEGVELYRQLDGIAFGRPAAGREKILRWRGGGPNKRYRQKKDIFQNPRVLFHDHPPEEKRASLNRVFEYSLWYAYT
jgi:hypothetical protein